MNQLTTRTLQVAMFYETAITMNELSALLDQVFIGHVGAGVGTFHHNLGRRLLLSATRVVIVVAVGICHLGGGCCPSIVKTADLFSQEPVAADG